ncbi:MAG: SlyX family protein [Gammaproteobacteria bacterium]|mgnify:CR=1 FL=1|nr:SlyX family protein [Gammaproteobacteria bacterium]
MSDSTHTLCSTGTDSTRLVELESRIAYLDDLVESLNTQVARQEQDLMRLWEAHRLLTKQLESVRERSTGAPAHEPPPPHY